MSGETSSGSISAIQDLQGVEFHRGGNRVGIVAKPLIRLILEPLLVALVAALLVRSMVQAYSIPSSSMEPTLEVGDQILVTPYRLSSPARGDVIVFQRPGQGDEVFVKRIIGLPGDRIGFRANSVSIDGFTLPEPYIAPASRDRLEPFETGESMLAPGCYFVMGDNRGNSFDSRAWGCLPREMILGRVRLVFWSAGDGHSISNASAVPLEPSPGVGVAGIRWSRLMRIVR